MIDQAITTPLTLAELDDVRRAERYMAIVETIPAEVAGPDRDHAIEYVNCAVAQLGAKALRRVVWPWSPKPARERGLRGKVRA